ncbi:MAG: alpha-glucosidase/alpha-galactosidase [Armatimonadetes bacterium]|nr:alpha-glucosidase/alpha-galactosidase [Armatimonadota bacterium]
MAKIAFLGAGSLGFGPKLIADILSHEALQKSDLWLVDPDAERLAAVADLARRVVAEHGLPTRIYHDTARERALDGAGHVIASIRVRTELEDLDVRIPLGLGGLRQTVADTVGIGGVLKGLRTIPPLLDIATDMERLCPDALLLNYTNPMAMIMWTLAEGSRIRGVGLCHSVQYTSEQLCGYIGVPRDGLRFKVFGINHMAWFTQLVRDGEDLYPRLRACLDDPTIVARDPVRFEIMRHFGWFVTESSRHMTEYIPYILQHETEMERLAVRWRDLPSLEETRRWRDAHAEKLRQRTAEAPKLQHSNEYGAVIINAVETDTPVVIHGNVPNTGLIDNLPPGCCVEVPCLIDGVGLRPCACGPLPPQCAALCASNVAMQGLVVKAVLEHDRVQAALLDPATAAQLPLPLIREAMEQLFRAQEDALPTWR